MAKSKKLLSMLLAVLMILSMIPAVSAAEETAPLYETNPAGWVEIATASQFNKWFYNKKEDGYILSNATEAITAKLVLTNDIKANVTSAVGSTTTTVEHNIILDLNGHTITASHTSRLFALYKGTLTIMNGNIVGTGANNAVVVGNMIYAEKDSTLSLINVNVTRTENTHLSKGGGVVGGTSGATINIIDCELDGGNTGYGSAGGVLYVDTATANISGSVLKNGTALSGGNVYVCGTGVVNMYSGEITGAQIPAKKFGTEEDNTAGSGAGVYVTSKAVFNMYGGEVHDNTAAYGYSRGGNVYVFDSAVKTGTPVFNFFGGKIYNGDAMLGDNIYTYATVGTATVNFFGGEVGAAKNPPASAAEKPRHNIFINKAKSVANVYGGTFLYNPYKGSADATVNFAECAVCTEPGEGNDYYIYTHGTAGETVAATCTAPGYTVWSCETCQSSVNVYSDFAEHTPAVKAAVEATCTEDGLTEGAYCSVCNCDLIPQVTVKGGHAYEASYISPTEMNTAGTHVYTCACGDTYQEADTLKRDTESGELDITDDTSTSAAASRGSHLFVRVTGLDPEKTQGFIGVKVYAGEKLLATTVRPAEKPLMLAYAPINIEINRDTLNWDTTWEEGALSAELVPTHFEVFYGDMETVRGIYAFSFTAEEWAAHPGVANGGAHYPMEPVKENEVPQTCETAGSYDLVVYCEKCDLEISRETVEVPAHTWDEGVYTDPTTEADGFTTFTCTVCNETKTEIDEGSKLPEVVPSVIVKQPEDATAESGETVQFKVEVEGDVVSYKWEYRKISKWYNTSMEGYNTDTLTVAVKGDRNGYDYRCIITFADGTVLTSEPAELTAITHVSITSNPNNQVVVNGYKGQFTVAAEGEGLKYRWYFQRPDGTIWSETSMEGCERPTVYIESTAARNGYKYRCKVTDVTGNVIYSEVATMQVLSFTAHPVETFAATGATVTFTVDTSVEEGFTYEWQYRRSATGNWTPTTMTGYNTDTLTVPAKGKNGYEYRCVLTGSKNSKIESKGAVLHVGEPVVINSQTGNQTVAAADNAVFTVDATNVYSYQWYYSKTEGQIWAKTTAEGNQTATLTVAAKGKNGYWYRCDMKGLDGVTYQTEIAVLTVQ